MNEVIGGIPFRRTPFRLEGFAASDHARIELLSLSDLSAQEQFEQWCAQVFESVGRRFLPVYRMADGEFEFILGPRPARDAGAFSRVLDHFRRLRAASGFTTVWGERYSASERMQVMERYAADLRKIACQGSLAVHLVKSPGGFAEQYHAPLIEWFRNVAKIDLDASNLTSFYFVYALLSGPGFERLVKDRSLAVLTSFDSAKADLLVRALRERGARSVNLHRISATRAMFETIDCRRIASEAEVCLVGGGVGSANLIAQLEGFRGPCLDAGICLECWVNPERRSERPFLLCDQQRQSD